MPGKALLFTANTPHVAQAWLMLTSFRDPQRGAFSGDIWVLSTELDDSARSFLDTLGVRFFEHDMAWAEEAMDWRHVVPTQSEETALEAFRQYRNKRMSKLIYTDWYAKHGSDYESVAICDNDLYAQRPVDTLFDCASNGCVNYTPEIYPMWPGTSLWRKDFRYRQVTGQWDYDPGKYEVNIGFIVAKPDLMADLFGTLRDRFQQLPTRLIRDDKWHDQDLTRVLRWQRPELFAQFPDDAILHLCGGGMEVVEEESPGHFMNRVSGAVPRIIHFGGGEWRNFNSIKRAYLVAPDAFYDNALQRPEQETRIEIEDAEYWPDPGVLVLRGSCVSRKAVERIILATEKLGVVGEATIAAPPGFESGGDPDWSGPWDCAIHLSDLLATDHVTATVLTRAGRSSANAPIVFKRSSRPSA